MLARVLSISFNQNNKIKRNNPFNLVAQNSAKTSNNPSFKCREYHAPEMDIAEYYSLTERKKILLRKECDQFGDHLKVADLYDKTERALPLKTLSEKQDFFEVAKRYSDLKSHPIICLGRSPKWFLGTSRWMQGGIQDYDFVAFSKGWYDKKIDFSTNENYIEKNLQNLPTASQENSYRLYLKLIKADPKSLVEKANKAKNTVIITDYVQSSRGITSFLDLMSRYAEKQGVLDDFSKSIEFFTIGCKDYHFGNPLSYHATKSQNQRVILPEVLHKIVPKAAWGDLYPRQTYFDIPKKIFEDFIENKNANECRSSFYPKELWTSFKPCYEKPKFSQTMKNYRNLLCFRILDALADQKLLRKI